MEAAPNKASESDQQQGQANKDTAAIIIPESAAIPQKPPSYTHADRARKSDKWTNDPPMFWATVAGVVVVAIYTTVAAWQACLTRESIVLADDTAKRQLRAHVLYDSASLAGKPPSIITLKFKNSGQTPAYNVTYWWKAKVFGLKETGILEFADTEDASSDIGAGGFFETEQPIFPADIEAARQGKKIIYVWGMVKYRDIYQRCQFSMFALRNGANIDTNIGLISLRGFKGGGTAASDDPENRCPKDGPKKYPYPTAKDPIPKILLPAD